MKINKKNTQINPSERKWFALKDKKLTRRTKGAIEVEMDVIYNHVRGYKLI